MKVIAAACMIAAASAQALDMTSLLMLDRFTGHGYGHGSRFGDALPLLALSGGLTGGAAGTDLTNLLLLDSFSGHGYGHGRDMLPLLALNGGLTGAAGNADLTNYFLVDQLQHSGSGHGDFLPLAMLSGQTQFGGNLGNLWALNEFSGGSRSAFDEMLPLAAAGVIPQGQLEQFWGLSQMQHGNNGILPLMSMTGQAIPTDMTNLIMLNEFSGHRGYYPRHYGRRAHGYGYPRRVVRPAAAPVAAATVAP